MKKLNIDDFVGKKYGMLTVIGLGDPYLTMTGTKQTTFICKCDCGNKKTIHSYNVRAGNSKSCGCVNSERISKINLKHGKTHTHEFKCWVNMKQRCRDVRNKYYKKGITVFSMFADSFEYFLSVIGNAPSNKHSIDRYPNPAGNYEPGNVRWATPKEQSKNTIKRYERQNKLGTKTC